MWGTIVWAGIRTLIGSVVGNLITRLFPSQERKLGRQEAISEQQAAVVKEVERAKKIEAINAQLNDDALRLRTAQFKRPG